jgi:hypothetical protein
MLNYQAGDAGSNELEHEGRTEFTGRFDPTHRLCGTELIR